MDLFSQEIGKKTCDDPRRVRNTTKDKANVTWTGGESAFLGSGMEGGNYCKERVRFIVSRKWSTNIISSHFCSTHVGVLLLRLDPNKTIKVV